MLKAEEYTSPIFEFYPNLFEENMRDYTWVLQDHSRSLTFAEVWDKWKQGSLHDGKNFEMPSKFIRGQYDYWFVFIVKNTSLDTIPLLIKMHGFYNNRKAWIISGTPPVDKEIQDFRLADSLHRIHFLVTHGFIDVIPPGRQDTIVCKIYDYALPPNLAPVLSDARTYELLYNRQNSPRLVITLLFLGSLLSIMLYALIRYVELREGVFLWYALYIFTLFFIGWRSFEYFYPYVRFSTLYIKWTYTKAIHTAILYIAYVNFIRYFLGNHPAALRRFVNGITISAIVVILLELILLQINLYWSWLWYYWSRILLILANIAFLPVLKRHDHPLINYLFWGSLFLITGEVISWFVSDPLTSFIAYVGVFIDLVLFSIAMAHRSKLVVREKEQVRAENQRLSLEKALETERLRTRIAQDIHDEVGANLTKISLTAQLAVRLPNISKIELKERLNRISVDARDVAGQLREIIFAINPDFDHFEDVQAYFREIASNFWNETTIEPIFKFGKTELNPIVTPEIKQQLLFIFKEAQNNIAKHADASIVTITFCLTEPNHYLLEIQDNGKGFLVNETSTFTNGLSGIRKRADRIGAVFTLLSTPNKGAIVRIEGCLS